MNRIDRLFGIHTLLQSKKYVLAEHIAEKFEISIRTVYRDLRALSEQGVPISFEPNKGYGVVQGYFLPPVSFNMEEANALLLMETIVYGFSDKSIQTNYSSALNKVKNVLRSSQKEKLDFLDDSMKLRMPTFVNHDFEYLSMIQNAISSRTIIEMEYKNKEEKSSSRQAEPIGLVFYALTWHMIAWCHLRTEYRDFKVSRIVKIRDTETPFKKTDHLTLEGFMKSREDNF